jgi:hypothetical protein
MRSPVCGFPPRCCPVWHACSGVTLEMLIGEEPRQAAKRGPPPKLQQQLERLSSLPKPKQRAIMEVLEAMIAQANR